MIGRQLGQYRITDQIGQGGMGVVYLAEDTRLGRRIALKVLPAEMSGDPARRARFEREARAIAALNHPNIVTLHSVEEVEGVCFLTMELVDGRRLTQLLERDGLPLPKLLAWSAGIADALVAAHRQGVVHRDLKPDNIMVTGEGRIKVLDFGLAKLRESALEGAGTALRTSSITEEGKILGTVSYMSPEQAEGKPLDHRSDIFSFGVVLYEMATGRRPFVGDTAIATISSILKDTPLLPHQVNSALPAQLGRIVRRCLAKEPERRYQSTEDLRNELRELKEESESGELTRESIAAATSPGARRGAPGSRTPVFLGLAGVLVLAVAVAAAGWLWMRPGAAAPVPVMQGPPIRMSRATTDGKVQEAAISPDGRYLAYVRREGAAQSLRLRHLVSGNEVQVVPPGETNLTSPTFSADGDYLHYVAIPQGHASGWAHRVSVLGGASTRLVDEVSAMEASPDGSRLAIMGGGLDVSWLRLVTSDGTDPRELSVRKGQDHFDSEPAWSPDGKSLAIVSHRFGEPQQIVLVDPVAGGERIVPLTSLRTITDVAWLPGAKSLVVSGSERPVNQRGMSQVWELSLAGVITPLTRDLNSYMGVTVTSDGSTIAAVQVERRSGIAVARMTNGVPGELTDLVPVSDSRAGLSGIAWLSEDHLAHTMVQGDAQQIFVTDVNSKSSRAVTTGQPHHDPAASADGRTVVVVRDEAEKSYLCRLDVETGRAQRLSEGPFDAFPVVVPDGSWIIYSTVRENIQLMKVAATGGAPVEMIQKPARCFGAMHDGSDLLCDIVSASAAPQPVLIPLAGGEPRPVAGLPDSPKLGRIGPDGRSITYLITRDGADELWSLQAGGGEPRRLARFPGDEIQDYLWSPGGTRLAVMKVSRSGDVVLLRRGAS